MEEKELDLTQLLKGCEGEKFYCPAYGNVIFDSICDYMICTHIENNKNDRLAFHLNGKFIYHKDGVCQLYPSRALYEKYPLDAKKAWQEWASERKPKRWTPKHTEQYWFINEFLYPDAICFSREDLEDLARVKTGNCFQTFELCNQAAEAVKETLAKFHERNTGE